MQKGPQRERGQSAIARRLDLSQASVRAWVIGTSRPEQPHREALELLTSGAVPAADWTTAEERRALRATLKRLSRSAPAAP